MSQDPRLISDHAFCCSHLPSRKWPFMVIRPRTAQRRVPAEFSTLPPGFGSLIRHPAELLIQLESWEAAIKSGLLSSAKDKAAQPIDIAAMLGWTRVQDNKTSSYCATPFPTMSSTRSPALTRLR